MEYYTTQTQQMIIKKEEQGFHFQMMTSYFPVWQDLPLSSCYVRDYFSKEMRLIHHIDEQYALKLLSSWHKTNQM